METFGQFQLENISYFLLNAVNLMRSNLVASSVKVVVVLLAFQFDCLI